MRNVLKFHVLGCLVILFSVQELGAQFYYQKKDISFRELGFKSDVVIAGQRPYQAFLFRLPRGRVLRDSSYLELKLRFSEALAPSSVVKIVVNDLPARAYTLRQIGSNEVTMRIPFGNLGFLPQTLGGKVDVPRYLKVVIEGFLIITGDACKDIETGALYIVASTDSYLHLVLAREQQGISIASFLSDTDGDIEVVIPPKAPLATKQSALWVMAELKKRFLFTPRDVRLYEPVEWEKRRTRRNYIVIADSSSLRSLPKPLSGVLTASTGTDKQGLGKDGKIVVQSTRDFDILLLSGATEEGVVKAASGFILDDMRSAMLGRVAIVRTVHQPLSTRYPEPPYVITFRNLGFSNLTLRGLGSVRASYQVLRQALGESPRNISLHLIGSTTAFRQRDDVYLNVYLNEILLESWIFGQGGVFKEKVVSFPDYALREENRIDVEFVYHPSDSCKSATFVGDIFDVSYLKIGASNPPETAVFESVPALFAKNTIMVISPSLSTSLLEAAATLLSVLDRDINAKYLYPPVFFSTTVSDRSLDSSNVIAVLTRGDPFVDKLKAKLPLDPTRSFRIMNLQNQTPMFSLDPKFPLGILQVHRQPTQRTMLLAIPHGEGGELLLHEFSEALRMNPRLMEGNIGLYGAGGNMYFFNTEKKTFAVEYKGEETFLDFLARYRYIIFAILWIAFTVAVILLTLYARKQRYKSAETRAPQ